MIYYYSVIVTYTAVFPMNNKCFIEINIYFIFQNNVSIINI